MSTMRTYDEIVTQVEQIFARENEGVPTKDQISFPKFKKTLWDQGARTPQTLKRCTSTKLQAKPFELPPFLADEVADVFNPPQQAEEARPALVKIDDSEDPTKWGLVRLLKAATSKDPSVRTVQVLTVAKGSPFFANGVLMGPDGATVDPEATNNYVTAVTMGTARPVAPGSYYGSNLVLHFLTAIGEAIQIDPLIPGQIELQNGVSTKNFADYNGVVPAVRAFFRWTLNRGIGLGDPSPAVDSARGKTVEELSEMMSTVGRAAKQYIAARGSNVALEPGLIAELYRQPTRR